MKRVDLIKMDFNWKAGQDCPYIEPNIDFDCILYENDIPIGFFLKEMPELLRKISDIADEELRSPRVPKSEMMRTDTMKYQRDLNITRAEAKLMGTTQYSTIIGSIAPKAHMRRYAPNHSSVHSVSSAQTFIKAMLKLAIESEKVIKEILPDVYADALLKFEDVPDKWKFGNIFTSSISNYNISAPFHRDIFNMETPNVIITKRRNSKGGNLYVPEFGATFNQGNNSMLVYPAWKSMHAVTPIIPTYEGGYRNSLVFYPLAAFTNEKLNS
jgi:hypothetical protein